MSKRRHPNKGARWVKDRYFRREGRKEWVFAASENDHGRTVTYRLYEIQSTKIVRHARIREEANPFEPKWELYFEQRILSKLFQGLEGQRVRQRMLKKQGGKYPICRQMLGENSHMHHMVWRVLGGDSLGIDNLVLTHETCHRQIHSQGNSVVKPVAA